MLALALLLASAAAAPAPELVHGKRFLMGTVWDVLAYDASRARAEAAIAAALDEVERLDGILSHYKPASELRRAAVAARRRAVRVGPELYEALQESVRYARLSRGAFDVTIAPLVRAWRAEEAPDDAAIRRLLACTGWEKLCLEPPDVLRIDSDCLELDLGGIGKGYAADRAAAVLGRAGVERALVNAGSSTIVALDAPPEREGWAIELPRGAGSIALARASLSTSEQERGHVIDPATGRPSASSWVVTVTAPTGTASDALSTALLVAGPERGAAFAAGLEGVRVRWIDRDGRIR